MRRIFTILLICLLPLQSFASVGMGVTMTGMSLQMEDASQAPCHEASQSMQTANQDCCDMQGVCQILCHLNADLPFSSAFALADSSHYFFYHISAQFQNADVRAGFKPPLL